MHVLLLNISCIHTTYRRLVEQHRVFGYVQSIIATRGIQPREELFSQYSPAYWLDEPDENTDPHVLTDEEYTSELSKYETAMREMLGLQVREQTSTQNTQLKE